MTLETHANGTIAVSFDGHSEALGKFSANAMDRAKQLSTGAPIESFASDAGEVEREIHLLVRRLTRRGLVEYRLVCSRTGQDQIVIEPQVPDYWPRIAPLDKDDVLVLSRFAYMRRRANEMVLESPRSRALFRICDPTIAAALVSLGTPQKIAQLRRNGDRPGVELFGLLVDCQVLLRIDPRRESGLRPSEGDANLVLWDFHDLLFHARSTEGRHANPTGGVFPYAGSMKPLPAVRPRWPGKRIDLRKLTPERSDACSPARDLLRKRHSTRSFDDQRPITLAELSQFLDSTARVGSKHRSKIDDGAGSPMVEYAFRPYPSGGASYELELYLAVDKSEGLARGFYHYDAGGHALVPLVVSAADLEATLTEAQCAMGADGPPQVLITIAARFGRVSWKYQSIAYALILKHVGVLTQTFYLMASDMGLGACAVGSANIERFAKMTGIEFHVEGAVGRFAIGRSAKLIS